ncbi:YdiU family protein [Gilvimarinus sp. SDUM040013]|uniref:Protein nucleotidyltransferase YdiU n=1 Tax=Gilvimarinus gilvus TaxID=3058038 RepID=A0ABU4S1G4_9GAMM|nr:YdiU family protein [Gilvimarinus sp. SDUM040013]MDO3386493.1 YdiU family protein [Gilvimarinus sp. SDUM040013]MDX6849069.1 YdiU family protein [Gilvimarinus sp. SDUM040013]
MLDRELAQLAKSLPIQNRFADTLPGDHSGDHSSREVLGACYSDAIPRPAKAPKLVVYAAEVAQLLGLPAQQCESEAFSHVFSGRTLLPDMQPYAMCYGGHQFGHWAGQLGDGRAINLGEVSAADTLWSLQLKGAGRTPYSRHADGLAVLRSSVREFLCSEAMHHLGVSTTRALSLVLTGESVTRDMFYDGHPQREPGAVVCRVAKSFVRFGSFEIFAHRGEQALLKQLADYTITEHYPQLMDGEIGCDTYVRWFTEIVERTARLMADWMRVGFVHGVMNTDNLSIIGDTIDYGPYGWLEGYDPNWTPNTTDAEGRRYCYGAQPNIGLWNLVRLANAIYPLVGEAKPLEDALERYSEVFADTRSADMAAKLGLAQYRDEDGHLIEDLLTLLQQTETDMTLFFRRLSQIDVPLLATGVDWASLSPLHDAYYVDVPSAVRQQTCEWITRYLRRTQESLSLAGESERDRKARMDSVNPKYVLRNYLAQVAIEQAEQGDYSEVNRLLNCLRNPYDDQPEFDCYAAKRPEWARVKPGCSMLSCSS